MTLCPGLRVASNGCAQHTSTRAQREADHPNDRTSVQPQSCMFSSFEGITVLVVIYNNDLYYGYITQSQG